MTFRFSVPPHFRKPKRLRKTPSLSLGQIIARVPKETKLKSRKVGIETVYKGRTPPFLPGYFVYKAETRNTVNGHRYRLTVFSPTAKVTAETAIIIDSPVAVFVFRYEYALAKRGNAFIFRSNGDAPVQTNPSLVPGVDHHMYRFLRYLVQNTNNKGLRQ